MRNNTIIWLASYPRSGNTFLRTVLWQCFGLHSASVYTDDLGGNAALEAYTGHLERDAKGSIHFPAGNPPLLKTHEYPSDEAPAIYMVRDGRPACASLQAFYGGELSLADVIEGRHRFGRWADHIRAWNPWLRPDTLLLRYEDLLADLPTTLDKLSAFLGRDPVATTIPDRDTIAAADGQWVKGASHWQDVLHGELLERFNETHRELLQQLGYPVK